MLTALLRWFGRAAGVGGLVFAGGLAGAEAVSTGQTSTAAPLPAITNLFQIRQLGLQNTGTSHPIRLEGQVCWVSPTHRTFAMMDTSGGVILEMEWLNQPLSI